MIGDKWSDLEELVGLWFCTCCKQKMYSIHFRDESKPRICDKCRDKLLKAGKDGAKAGKQIAKNLHMLKFKKFLEEYDALCEKHGMRVDSDFNEDMFVIDRDGNTEDFDDIRRA